MVDSTVGSTGFNHGVEVGAGGADSGRMGDADDAGVVEAGWSGPLVLGVAGSPETAAASLSPRMMRAALEAMGIEGYYVPLAIRERAAPKALRSIVRLGFRGCNVTMPHKAVAAQVATSRSELVEATGAANTLVVQADGSIHAEATDGPAVVDAVRDRGVDLAGSTVLLLGAGGAAVQVAVALARAGCRRIEVWNRTRASGEALLGLLRNVAPALELQLHQQLPIRIRAHVVVSCVPADAIASEDLAGVDQGALFVDLAYRRDRGTTPVMVAAAGRDEGGVDGREILVRQGAASLRAWCGVEPPIEVMKRAVQ